MMHSACYTEIKPNAVFNSWTIKNFDLFYDIGKTLVSPNFWSNGYTLTLSLTKSDGNMKVHILLDFKEFRDNAQIFISLLNDTKGVVSKKKLNELEPKVIYLGSRPPTTSAEHIYSKEYLREKFKVSPPTELTICTKIRFIADTVTVLHDSRQLRETEMVKCLLSLWDDKKYCDVTIVVGNKESPAHKAILAAHSQVFAAMFENQMKESGENRVFIEDFDFEVVQEMLTFIYTGEAPNLSKMAFDLFAIADKYAIGTLKSICEKDLCSQVSVENAVENLRFARTYNAKLLLKAL